jgi:V/A-type H+-transporting ATPase subunit D
MARLSLSKATLSHEQQLLKSYRQFLPSLDLKRRQLIAERARAVAEVAEREREIERLREEIGRELPMLANRSINLDRLVTVKTAAFGQQNLVGVRLPVLSSVEYERRPYSPLAKPHWVDRAADRLEEALEQRLRLRAARRRLELLEAAVKTVTQRVNLFDKVLIPRAQANIKKIRIYLADAEREGVVRAKTAKRKTAARAADERMAEL